MTLQTNLTVVARIKAQPGKEALVKQELLKLLAPTRAESGCINYDLHQDPKNPALFLFHENWTGEEALAKHLDTPHIAALKSRAAELLAEPVEITLWNRIG